MNIKKFNFRGLLFVLAALYIFSCDGFMDVHKEYIEDGEIIYATRPDSVSFIAGHNRILFRCWIYNGVNVKDVIVRWDNRADSIVIPSEFSIGRDSIEILLPNMPEKSYTFEIYSVDEFGHRSLVETDFGTSYGDIFQSSLSDRRIKSVELTDKFGQVEWFSAPEGLVFNEIRYRDEEGDQVVSRTAAKSFLSTLTPRPAAGTSFEYRSSFIPEAESIDTFYTDWIFSEIEFPSIFLYDRSDWEVLEVSDETASDGGGMHTLIDDNLGTYWHSNWEGESTPLPHWAIIDMKFSRKIALMDVYRRSGSTDSKSVRIFLNDEPDSDSDQWTEIGSGVFSSGDKLTVETDTSTEGRYLMLYLPDSNRDPFTSIAEIYVYGN